MSKPQEGDTSGTYVWTAIEYTDETDSSNTDYQGVYNDSVFGAEDDVFSIDSLTIDEINSEEFGAVFRVQPAADGTKVKVDAVSIEIFYIPNEDLGTIPGDLGNSFRAVVMDGPKMVAVGMGGTIYTSSDNGATWTSRDSTVTEDLHGVTWDGSQYIACGANGVLITSANGETWASQARPTNQYLFGIEYFAGNINAVGGNKSGFSGATIAALRPQVLVPDIYEVPD